MLNIIRADIHRLSHGKAVPLTFLILLVGIFFGTMITEVPAPELALREFILIVPFFLALIYAVCAPDFNSSTIKNSVAAGVSRGKLYAARVILSTLLCELLFLCAVAINYLGKLIYPSQIAPSASSDIIAAVGCLCFMVFAMAACGCAIAFITRRGAILNVAFLGLFFGGQIMLSLVAGNLGQEIMFYEFLTSVNLLAEIQHGTDQLTSFQIIRALSVGAAYMIVSTVLGVLLFKKAELK